MYLAPRNSPILASLTTHLSLLSSASQSCKDTPRELTSVGVQSVYQVAVDAPPTVGVTVKPTKLVFKKVGDKLRYTVTFVSKKGGMGRNAFGSISWNNALHQVRSPVAYTWTQMDD
ncbi:hypothetical protein Leryth_022997 [Lithospermum erythrorhizon]|nr:hypothetical protein Leryth_022997 [Lithospermum erythrorhizon]